MKVQFLTATLLVSIIAVTAFAAPPKARSLEEAAGRKAVEAGLRCQDTNFWIEKVEPESSGAPITFYLVKCGEIETNSPSVLLSFRQQRGFSVVSFPEPDLNEAGEIVGWSSTTITMNLSFDESRNVFVTKHMDPEDDQRFALGTYDFVGDKMVLKSYILDDTADNKLNPVSIYRR